MPDEAGELATAGSDADVRIGGAVAVDRLRSDEDYRNAAATHFTSITAENAMKWSKTRPSPDEWFWDDADYVVDFAEDNGLEVRGHTLVWGQAAGNGVPDWLTQIDDPEEFRAAVLDGVSEQVGRYRGRVQRWDVVNEPLHYLGVSMDQNIYLERMGPDYIAEVFRVAHEADPDAELWLNEFGTEIWPDKAELLVSLVTQLVDAGVPIHGVGFQTHLTFDVENAPETQTQVMARIRALDLDVAVTELDIPIGSNRDESEQVDLYRRVTESCISQGCTEITTWGIDDGATWLDAETVREANPYLDAFDLPSRPLLLDESFRPKPAYLAVVQALRA